MNNRMNNKKLIATSLLASIIILVSLINVVGAAENTDNLKIKTIDTSNNPISGLTVSAYEKDAGNKVCENTTNSNGNIYCTVSEEPHIINISRENGENVKRSIFRPDDVRIQLPTSNIYRTNPSSNTYSQQTNSCTEGYETCQFNVDIPSGNGSTGFSYSYNNCGYAGKTNIEIYGLTASGEEKLILSDKGGGSGTQNTSKRYSEYRGWMNANDGPGCGTQTLTINGRYNYHEGVELTLEDTDGSKLEEGNISLLPSNRPEIFPYRDLREVESGVSSGPAKTLLQEGNPVKFDVPSGDYRLRTDSITGTPVEMKVSAPSRKTIKPNTLRLVDSANDPISNEQIFVFPEDSETAICNGITNSTGYTACDLDEDKKYDLAVKNPRWRTKLGIEPSENLVINNYQNLDVLLSEDRGLINKFPKDSEIKVYNSQSGEEVCEGISNGLGRVSCSLSPGSLYDIAISQYNISEDEESFKPSSIVKENIALPADLSLKIQNYLFTTEALSSTGEPASNIGLTFYQTTSSTEACEGETNSEGKMYCTLDEDNIYDIKSTSGLQRADVPVPGSNYLQLFSGSNQALKVQVQDTDGDTHNGLNFSLQTDDSNSYKACGGVTSRTGLIGCGLSTNDNYNLKFSDGTIAKSGLKAGKSYTLNRYFKHELNNTLPSKNDKIKINGGVWYDDNVELQNENISVYLNGQKLGNTISDSNGNFSYTFDGPSSTGTHTVTLNYTDRYGIFDQREATFAITDPENGIKPINVTVEDGGKPTSEKVWISGGNSLTGYSSSNGKLTFALDNSSTYTVNSRLRNISGIRPSDQIKISPYIKAVVRDGEGNPASGEQIVVKDLSASSTQVCSTSTDSSGIATCDLKAGKGYDIFLNKDQEYRIGRGRSPLIISTTNETNNLGRLSFQFLEESGEFLTGEEVRYKSSTGSRLCRGKTTGDGQFYCNTDVSKGAFNIETSSYTGSEQLVKSNVQATNYGSNNGFNRKIQPNLFIDARNVDGTKSTGTRTQVYNSKTGKERCSGQTNSNGLLFCSIDSGSLYDIKTGGDTERYEVSPPEETVVQVGSPSFNEMLNLTIKGSDGEFLNNTKVSIFTDSSGELACQGRTNPNGEIKCGLGNGEEYNIESQGQSLAQTVQVPASITRSRNLEITVVDDEGQRLEDVEISALESSSGDLSCSGTTNSEGTLLCGATPDEIYDINTSEGLERLNVQAPEETTVQYSDNNKLLNITFKDRSGNELGEGKKIEIRNSNENTVCSGETGPQSSIKCGLDFSKNYQLFTDIYSSQRQVVRDGVSSAKSIDVKPNMEVTLTNYTGEAPNASIKLENNRTDKTACYGEVTSSGKLTCTLNQSSDYKIMPYYEQLQEGYTTITEPANVTLETIHARIFNENSEAVNESATIENQHKICEGYTDSETGLYCGVLPSQSYDITNPRLDVRNVKSNYSLQIGKGTTNVQVKGFSIVNNGQTAGNYSYPVEIENTGNKYAYNIEVDLSLTNNWKAYPSKVGSLAPGEKRNETVKIEIPDIQSENLGTTPQINWTNPDLTYNQDSGSGSLEVKETGRVKTNSSIDASIKEGSDFVDAGDIKLESVGNAPAEAYYNISGLNWDFGFEPFPPTNEIDVGNERNVTIYAKVPENILEGSYKGTVNLYDQSTGNRRKDDEANITINVPASSEYSTQPQDLGVKTGKIGDSGTLEQINVTNNGNQNLSFAINKEGEVTNFIQTNVSTFNLQPGKTRSINLEYSIPRSASGGLYDLNISLGCSPNCSTNTIPLQLDVVDTPPEILDYSYGPKYLEPGETVDFSINATDNDEPRSAWISLENQNITADINDTIRNTMGDYIYEASFTPETSEGVYDFRFNVNDSAGLTTQSKELRFEVVPETNIETNLNQSSYTLENVNSDSGKTINSKATISNSGDQEATNANYSLELPNGWSWTNEEPKDMETITAGEEYERSFEVNIPAGTSPGTYLPSIITRWTDANEEYSETEQTFRVEISENADMEMQDQKSISMNHSSQKTVNLNIDSAGNQDIQGVEASCNSNDCSDFSFTFENPDIIQPGNTKQSNISITAPEGLPDGTYSPTIEFESERDKEEVELNIDVVKDTSFELNPEAYNTSAGPSTSLNLENLEVSNNGNQELEIAMPTTSILSFDASNFNINISESKEIGVELNTNDSSGEYELNPSISGYDRETFNQMTENLSLNLTVYDYEINTTSVDKTSDIVPGDTISITADAFYQSSEITDNMNWQTLIGGKEAQIISQEHNEQGWNIEAEAPKLDGGQKYNVKLIGNYTEIQAKTADTKTNYIAYKDQKPPKFPNIEASDAEKGDSSSLLAEVEDKGNVESVDNVKALVETPSGNNITYDLSKNGVEYTGRTGGFSNEGYYDVYFQANDTQGNLNTSQTFFQIYTMEDVSGDIKDPSGNGINTEISMKKPGTSETLDKITASTGNYDTQIKSGKYDVEFDINDSETIIELEDVNSSNLQDPMEVDSGLKSSYVTLPNTDPEKELTGTAVKTNKLQGHTGRISFDYSEYENDLGNVNNLVIHKCSDWPFNSKADGCESNWTKQETEIDSTNKVAYTNISSFSSYYLSEEGGDTTDSNDNQTNDNNNNQDNGGSQNSGSGGGGGGGGSYGGGGDLDEDEFDEGINQLLEALEDNETSSALRFGSQSIEAQLKPGEERKAAISIQNNVNQSQTLDIFTSSNIRQFVSSTNSITLEGGEREDLTVQISAEESAEPNSYSGYITVEGPVTEKEIPVNIRIVPRDKKLLDLSINPVLSKIAPGEDLRVETSIINQGYSENVDVDLNLKLIDTESLETVAETAKTVAVSTTTDKVLTLNVPEDIDLETYEVRATGNYSNKDVPFQAQSIKTVEVSIPFWDQKTLGLEHSTFGLSLLGLLLISAGGYSGYAYIRKKQLEKQRYDEKLDLSTLPHGGTREAHLGKLAERGSRSFLELEEMTTHTLIAGATGSGKTVTGQVMVEEALQEGTNVIVLDPTAQWSGFLRECNEKSMINNYNDFGMSRNQATGFNGNIRAIEPGEEIDITPYLQQDEDGEIIVFSLHKLDSDKIDEFVNKTIQQVFDSNLPESDELDTLIVYDEVHRLLEKFGGNGEGLKQLERGAREFRKWGVGMVLLSQVVSDFSGEIRANIGTTVQMRTQYEKDLNRMRDKYGMDTVKSIVKANVGSGMLQNSEYNRGRPYFINFRPLLHSPHRLSDEELEKYEKFNQRIDKISNQIDQMEEKGEDVFDYRSELKLARKNLRKGSFNLVNIYLDEIEDKLS